MIVTGLAESSANRYKVFIDQEFAFVLYKGELRRYKLSEGQEVREEDYREILEIVLPKRAKLRAMNLLQKKRYTQKQLKDKLQEGFYPEEIIEETIAYVKYFHYLDDLQLAIDYITYHEAHKTRRKLISDLIQKGISEDVIKRAFEEWEASGGSQNEQDMIYKLLEKKRYTPECGEKEKRRIYAFLLRKGFSVDNVNRALRMYEL